jgi:UDP:flavonoid glycosyltransferase YjiC (YdhE family)
MRAGRPTVIVPFAHDQFDNAARVRRLGISETVVRSRVSAETLAGALRRVLEDPECRRRAEAIAQCLNAERGDEVAAVRIEGLVNSRAGAPQAMAAVT